jgi:cell division protein FtsW
MLFVSKVNYKVYKKFALPFMGVNILLLLMTRFSPLGIELNYAKRWLDIGFSTLMTSEVTKFACIIMTATIISNRKNQINNLGTIIQPFIYVGLSVLLIIIQPDLSTSVTILFVTFGMLFIAGMHYIYVAGIASVGIFGIILLILFEPYRLKRFTTFLDPFKDPLGNGYQVIQSLYALGSGGIFGLGLGKSRQKFFYLPEPQNDFIFAIIGEELGYIGGIFVLILFAFLIIRCLQLVVKAPDMFSSMLVAGITLQIGIQVLINIGVATSSIPNTGLPLPFISYGGTSLVIFMCAMGIILNVSRYSK